MLNLFLLKQIIRLRLRSSRHRSVDIHIYFVQRVQRNAIMKWRKMEMMIITARRQSRNNRIAFDCQLLENRDTSMRLARQPLTFSRGRVEVFPPSWPRYSPLFVSPTSGRVNVCVHGEAKKVVKMLTKKREKGDN